MRWLQLVAPAGAILLLACAAILSPTAAHAEDNVVSVDPAGIVVAPGGSFTVAIVDDPTPASTAIWAIDVVFDPDVVSVPDPIEDCDTIDTPGGAIGAFDCQVIDADKDGTPETVKVLGVVLFTGTETGLINVSTLADITFTVTGEPGACTDLHMRIRSHADKDGEETGALVQDGQACIEADAPPSGTATAVPFTPRTSEPTDPATPSPTAPPDGQQSLSPGQTRPTDETGGGAGSRSPATGSGTDEPVGGGSEGDDDGGTSALVWVAVAGVLAVLAAGAAWFLVRMRGSTPPSDTPPGDQTPS